MGTEENKELTEHIDALIRELEKSNDPKDIKTLESARKVQASRQELKKKLGTLQESLDYLRISVKYLVFDLEATRRENEYLQRLLKDELEDDEEFIR